MLSISSSALRLQLCAATLLLAAAASTHAGLFETGGTGINTTYAIESSVSWRDTDSKRTLVLPNLEFIAPVNARMVAGIESGYTWVNDAAGEHNGLRDVELYTKWRFLDDDPTGWQPALAIKPTFKVPTGDDARGLGDGVRQLELPLAMSKQLGRLNVGAEITYLRVFGRDDQDKIYLSSLLQWSLTPTVRLGAELGGDTLADDTGKYHWRGNIGVKWKLDSKMELQSMVGKTIEYRRGEPVRVAKVLLEYKF